MHRFILTLVVLTLTTLPSCTIENDAPPTAPPTVIVITPNLPKLDCAERARRAAVDVASRGLLTSEGVGKQAIDKARADCEEENKRRGY